MYDGDRYYYEESVLLSANDAAAAAVVVVLVAGAAERERESCSLLLQLLLLLLATLPLLFFFSDLLIRGALSKVSTGLHNFALGDEPSLSSLGLCQHPLTHQQQPWAETLLLAIDKGQQSGHDAVRGAARQCGTLRCRGNRGKSGEGLEGEGKSWRAGMGWDGIG